MIGRGQDIFDYFRFAISIALKAEDKYEKRKAVVGAIGWRKDGAIVHAFNAGDQRQQSPDSHAEARIIRKLGQYSPEVYVARIRRDTWEMALARPCVTCLPRLRNKRVKKIYYTISDTEYGVIDLEREAEKFRIKFLI